MFAQVFVDHKARWLQEPLLYAVPRELQGRLELGSAVEVPFGKQQLSGFVVGLQATQTELLEEQIKPVARLLEEAPFFSQQLLGLVDWLHDFYGGSRIECLHCVIPGPVLARLREFNKKRRAVRKRIKDPTALYPRPVLTPRQTEALEQCWQTIRTGGTTLLQGITGSGKTEVYLHLAERIVGLGQGVIVLVPEVSLTPQAIERYKGRLGDQVAVLHSALSERERREQWHRLRDKECLVALGTRSAVFAPMENLSLIIIDEEHDGSYKQDQTPRYHARQVAHWRAEYQIGRGHPCGLILGSATPSLETLYTARPGGRYTRVVMEERASGAQLPSIQMIDMRKTRWGKSAFSPPLLDRLRTVLERREQAVILYNRRGFANFVQCRDCANVIRCDNCSVSLVFHRSLSALRCHYCGLVLKYVDACPSCSSPHLEMHGAGTQKIEEDLQEKLPGARILRMDRDTTAHQGAHADILGAFGRHEADILLGTQMVAKGLDFPKVTLVGVLSADAGLHIPDFRAPERTFQLLTQVAGRAGRAQAPGHVVIQAYDLENPCLEAVRHHDYAGFAAYELEQRQSAGYPPFCRLVRVLVTGPEETVVERFATLVGERLRDIPGFELVGPAPCPMVRLRSLFRWHCLLKGRRVKELADLVRTRLEFMKRPEQVRIVYDPDPQSLM